MKTKRTRKTRTTVRAEKSENPLDSLSEQLKASLAEEDGAGPAPEPPKAKPGRRKRAAPTKTNPLTALEAEHPDAAEAAPAPAPRRGRQPAAQPRPATPERVSAKRINEIVALVIKDEKRTPIAEAKLFKALRDETGWNPSEFARHITGTEKPTISAPMRNWRDRIIVVEALLELSRDQQRMVEKGDLDPNAAWLLSKVPEPKRDEMVKAIRGGLTDYNGVRALAKKLGASVR